MLIDLYTNCSFQAYKNVKSNIENFENLIIFFRNKYQSSRSLFTTLSKKKKKKLNCSIIIIEYEFNHTYSRNF